MEGKFRCNLRNMIEFASGKAGAREKGAMRRNKKKKKEKCTSIQGDNRQDIDK